MLTFHKTKRIIITFSLFILLTNFCFSQPARRHWERIEQIKKLKILDILELDEETSAKFLSKYNEIERKIKEKSEDLDKTVEKLNNRITENAPNQELSKLSEQLISQHKELQKLHLDKLTDMKSLLDDRRYAAYIAFESNFHKELQKRFIETMKKIPHENFKPKRQENRPGR